MLNFFYYQKDVPPVERAEWLDKPLHDGGNWIIFRRLARKYGVVPKNMYRESWPSSHSSEMNSILCHLLQRDIQHCSTIKDVAAFNKFRNERLKQVLHILCSCMGKPPMSHEFSLTLETVQNKPFQLKGTAMSTFNAIDATFDIDQHIQIIHDPRASNLTWYTTQHQSLQDTPELFFNVKDMKQICAAVTLSIKLGRGVWFACNMNEDVSPQLQGMAKGLYRPDKFIPEGNPLEMSKIDRMNWGRAHCNHAMLIVGVEFEAGEAKAFEIENSWGATGPGKGFYKMTADWFQEHAYTVVIHRDVLLKADIAVTERPENIAEYPYYDIFG
jgi:bleomycin hydrolase